MEAIFNLGNMIFNHVVMGPLFLPRKLEVASGFFIDNFQMKQPLKRAFNQ
jgi:hypothetical protein